jgi:hypothetical protein
MRLVNSRSSSASSSESTDKTRAEMQGRRVLGALCETASAAAEDAAERTTSASAYQPARRACIVVNDEWW